MRGRSTYPRDEQTLGLIVESQNPHGPQMDSDQEGLVIQS